MRIGGFSVESNIVRLGICQMAVTPDKALNNSKAQAMIKQAAAAKCQMAILPEMFNCPYETSLFSQYAESYPEGESITMLAAAAAANKIVVVGGSVPERTKNNQLYNTSFVFDEQGKLVERHRKMHLFDVDIVGGTVCKESSVLTPGQEMTVIKVAGLTVGIGICYDIRFPELSRLMALAGADILIFPAVFGLTTGPVHWELTLRARAVDNQVFVVGAAPGNLPSGQVYGHSAVVDPWGEILGMAGSVEEMLVVEINLDSMNKVRKELPLLKHRREEIYNLSYYK